MYPEEYEDRLQCNYKFTIYLFASLDLKRNLKPFSSCSSLIENNGEYMVKPRKKKYE